jgi:PPOX class probable F420-dependent enzyme
MTVAIPDSARDVIESGQLAHLVTVNRDGSPHVTIVWVGLDGDEIVIGKLSEDHKVRNIRRDPRVSLSMEAKSGEQYGMKNYVVVEGTARVTEGGAPALLQELAQRYIGPGATFPPMPNPPAGFIIRVTPEKVRGMGPWGTTF